MDKVSFLLPLGLLGTVKSGFHTGQGGFGSGVELALVIHVLVPLVDLNVKVEGFNKENFPVMFAGEHEPLKLGPGGFDCGGEIIPSGVGGRSALLVLEGDFFPKGVTVLSSDFHLVEIPVFSE